MLKTIPQKILKKNVIRGVLDLIFVTNILIFENKILISKMSIILCRNRNVSSLTTYREALDLCYNLYKDTYIRNSHLHREKVHSLHILGYLRVFCCLVYSFFPVFNLLCPFLFLKRSIKNTNNLIIKKNVIFMLKKTKIDPIIYIYNHIKLDKKSVEI